MCLAVTPWAHNLESNSVEINWMIHQCLRNSHGCGHLKSKVRARLVFLSESVSAGLLTGFGWMNLMLQYKDMSCPVKYREKTDDNYDKVLEYRQCMSYLRVTS